MLNLDKLKTSASMELTRMAKELKALGREVYTLSIGDTHFAPPASVMNNLKNMPLQSTHYVQDKGIDTLRTEISKKYLGFSAESVMVVPGLKQGFYYALQAIGLKRVAVLEPAWLGYQATCVLAGCQYLSIDTYSSDWLNKLQTLDFDILMLCQPNNPDGKIFNQKEIDQIHYIVCNKNAWIILDLIYERYSYSTSIKSKLSSMFGYPKTIIGNGFSKSHAMTGFRLGYLLTNDKGIMNNLEKIQQNMATCANSFGQYLLAENINPPEIADFVVYYKNNRNEVLNIFPEWQIYQPDGGFYYFVNLMEYQISNAEKFCNYALNEGGVAIVPGSAYGSGYESYIRVSFSLDTNSLILGLNKLREIIAEYTINENN